MDPHSNGNLFVSIMRIVTCKIKCGCKLKPKGHDFLNHAHAAPLALGCNRTRMPLGLGGAGHDVTVVQYRDMTCTLGQLRSNQMVQKCVQMQTQQAT